ncbi:MAG: AraC family transcriptional regulator, partial [Hespellia sp.]|nr:AraC family transcriptional regulator [Hespellia sp.]
MAHTQYSLSEIMNQQIIEQLLYVSNATYGKDWVSVFHSHSF